VVEAEKCEYIVGDPIETEARFRIAKRAFFDYASVDKRIGKDMIMTVSEINDANEFIDNALSVVRFKVDDVQDILNLDDTLVRLIAFDSLFQKERQIIGIEREIGQKVKNSIDKSQKEFYLREQLKAIHTELGDDEDEKEELIRTIKEKHLPEDIEKKALKEIARLDKINPSSPDYSIILNYLDWIKEVPFNETTEDTADLKKAKEILDGNQ
jgi:ATP-dependent Lon protease